MGKVIKIIRSFISAAILALIVLPVALSLLLYLPWIQDFARRAAAGFLSDKLQTVVSVDKLHLKLFSRVTLDGFYVQDYMATRCCTRGGSVVPLQSLNVFTGAVTLGHVGLEDVRFDLMQDSTRTSNLRQILQRIKRKEKREKKRKFRLHAAGVTIRDMDFRHRKFDVKPREYGVNFTDLDVRRFSLKVRDVSVEGDSVALAIDSLTLRERCGLHIRNLSTPAFGISGTGMRFDDLRLTTDESDVRMAYLYFDYDTWKGYKDFLNDVRIRSEFSRSTVSFRTIAYFAQGLRRWQTVLRDASGSVDRAGIRNERPYRPSDRTQHDAEPSFRNRRIARGGRDALFVRRFVATYRCGRYRVLRAGHSGTLAGEKPAARRADGADRPFRAISTGCSAISEPTAACRPMRARLRSISISARSRAARPVSKVG